MSQQANPRLSADAAADRIRATRGEVLTLLTEAEGLDEANITKWFRAREQPLVRSLRSLVKTRRTNRLSL